MFSFFKKKKPEDAFRDSVRKGFDDSVKEVIPSLMNNPMTDGLMVEAAIANFYQAMKNSAEIQIIGLSAKDWIPEEILEEECNRALKKYLE